MQEGARSDGEDEDANVLDECFEERKEDRSFTNFTMINTNARSICPKINSLLDTIEELDACMAVVTETWLADGDTLEDDKQDLFLGAGISMLCRNRKKDSRGMSYGGVALFYREDMCNFKKLDLKNEDDFEVLVAVGSLVGHSRKIITIACYIPPNYPVPRGNSCLEYIASLVIEVKRRYKDPYIIISGDFNQWNPTPLFDDFTDIKETSDGPTRGNHIIDRTFHNFEQVTSKGILNPLQTDMDLVRESDHKVCYLTAKLAKKAKYRWLKYSYRYKNPDSCKQFGEWLVSKDWSAVVQANGSNKKAELYQAEILNAIESFFPLRTTRRRNIDPPWINGAVKKMIKRRKRIFVTTGGRTAEWKRMKKLVQNLIDKRRKKYQETQKEILLAEDATRNFFRHTKNYMSKQRPPPFDVMDLFPGKNEHEVSELLAAHFNAISDEFRPIDPVFDIPTTYSKRIPVLEVHEVAIRLRKFRKPKSMVKGDIFPDLVTQFADLLAVPLTSIYNEISETLTWPKIWKEEFVTVIPKTRTPTEIGQLRNISCTMLASKVYESYVLEWALEQVTLKENQFGGSKGCSPAHLLISVWQNILTDLEDCRAATLLTSIDYAKAFNRMQFQACLRSFANHGASNEIIGLIATFLTGRRMTVRVGNEWSKPRPVNGGVPQGSILGVLLFNLTTDNLEDDPLAITPTNISLASTDSDNDCQPDPPSVSTPISGEVLFEPGLTPFRKDGGEFVFLNKTRNIRRALFYDPELTVLRDQTIPEEPNPVTSAVWKPRNTSEHKYIDDNLLDTKLDMETVPTTTTAGGKPVKNKHSVSCQNSFRRIVRNAELIGMKVNSSKTAQVLVSDALSFEAVAHIYSISGEKIESSDRLKMLGFTFSSKPSCAAHIETVRRSFRGKYWLIIHLKQDGYSETELVRAYTTMIRPIAEYLAVVWHPMLTDQQDELVERLQSTALRYIYGYGLSYKTMREMAGLDTLRHRRIALCDNFTQKCLNNPRFSKWFPEADQQRRSRHTLPYKEYFARCDRLRNSPLYYMRRRLNGKPGKDYGKRNCKYRD